MGDLRVIPGVLGLYDKVRRWRRYVSTQSLPIAGRGHGVVKVTYPGLPPYWIFGLLVNTLNYSTREEREQDLIDANYQAFLNNLPCPVQWRFSVRQVDPALLTAAIRQRTLAETDEQVLCWLQDQIQHLDSLVRDHEIPHTALNLVVPFQVPKKETLSDEVRLARKEAGALEARFVNSLKAVGLAARRMTDRELDTAMWADLNPDLVLCQKEPSLPGMVVMGSPPPPPVGIVELPHHTSGENRDAIDVGVQNISDCLAPKDLEFHKWYFEINTMFRCVLAAHTWPTYLNPSALRYLTNCNLNLDVSLHLTPFPTDQALNFLDKRIGQLTLSTEKDRMEGFAQDHRVLKFIDQAKYCREALEQNKARWFYTALYVAVTSRSLEQLEQDVKTATTLLNQAGIKAAPVYRQQKEGLWTTMPLALDLIQQQRNMLTDAVANLAPFDCQVWMQPGGRYAGINRLNNSVVALNVWGLQNYNVCVLGLPGSGKTVWERHDITHNHCMTDAEQILGDPDGEFDAMVGELGGQVVRLGAGSPHRINLMDLALDWDNNEHDYRKGRPLDKKIDQVTGWLEHYLGAPAGQDAERRFTPLQTARVKHAIVRAYGKYGITPENQGDILKDGRLVTMPVLLDLQDELRSTEPDLAEAMDMFRFGTMAIFNARTNVDVTNRLVSLNLRDLDPATRDMAMPWLVNWMWGRVGINRARKRRTHLYFEEVLAFLSNPIAAEYVSMIWTRGRKWWCSPCAVSQLIFRLLEHSVGATIVKSSDLKVLLDQGDAIDDVTAALKLSPQEAGFVRGCQPGEGLYVIGPWRVPFRLVLSQYQYSYYTTRPGEMKE